MKDHQRSWVRLLSSEGGEGSRIRSVGRPLARALEPGCRSRCQSDMRIGRLLVAVALAGLMGVLILAVVNTLDSPDRGGGGYGLGPLPNGSTFYRAADQTLFVHSCAAEFRVTETAQRIVVAYAGWNFGAAASCAEYWYWLRLRAPLGIRRVTDETTGQTVAVGTWPQPELGGLLAPAPSLPPRSASGAVG